MYLGLTIASDNGKPFAMAGILDLATSMEGKKLSMGYRTIGLDGEKVKGHEFHYSRLVTAGQIPAADCTVHNARGERVEAPMYYSDRLLASYMHLYWGEDTGLLQKWLH